MKALLMALAMSRGMLGSVVGISLLLSTALPAWAAEVAGEETVAQWRLNRGKSFGQGAVWSHGVASAMTALGMECRVPATVGELAAYMMYRAEPQATVAGALQTHWQETGCAVPPQAGQSEAKSDAMEVVRNLWKIRTSSDPVWLRKHIEAAKFWGETIIMPKADEGPDFFRLSELLARDRLRELSEKQRMQ